MTEMEMTILAIIARDGPMSAYDVRMVFSESLTPGWSSSTGSVYPAIRRLEKAGMVRGSPPSGTRKRRSLRVTDLGSYVVRDWLAVIDVKAAAPTPDPIRTRMYFLRLLSGEQQLAAIASAAAATEAALVAAQQRKDERVAAGQDPLQQLAAEAVIFELRARLSWLERLEEQISKPEC